MVIVSGTLGFLTSVSKTASGVTDTLMSYIYLSDGTRLQMTGSGGGTLLYRGPFTLRLTGSGSGTPAVSFLRAETADSHAVVIADGAQSTGNVYLYVTDHLSSVRAIVDIDGNVMERNDYYTFGKRHTTGRNYASLAASPFLFSGKEDQSLAKRIADQDATASAKLNFLNFGARHYDPVVPRWLTQDPLSEKYYNLNPYSYCAADPVTLIDPDGYKIIVKGSHSFIENVDAAKKHLPENNVDRLYTNLSQSKHIYTIVEGKSNSYDPNTRTITWSPNKMAYDEEHKTLRSSTVCLSHEMGHAFDHDDNPEQFIKDVREVDSQYGLKAEKTVIEGVEQDVARGLKEISNNQVTRTSHFGYVVDAGSLSPKSQSTKASMHNNPLEKINTLIIPLKCNNLGDIIRKTNTNTL